jgi:hypothetical protein
MGRAAKNVNFCRAPGMARTTNKTRIKKKITTTRRNSRQVGHHHAWDAAHRATTASKVLAARRWSEWRERVGGGDSLHASRLSSSAVKGRRGRRARRTPPRIWPPCTDEVVGHRGEDAMTPTATHRCRNL